MVLKAQADLADKDGKKMDIGSGLYRCVHPVKA